MKRNKFLAFLLAFVAAGFVACTDDEPTIDSENNPLREPMTVFRSGKNGYGSQGSGNTETNPGGTGDHWCGLVQGTKNDLQVEWYGIKGCAGYRVKCIIQGRDFDNPSDCLVDTILPPNVLKLRVEDLQYRTGFRFAIQTLSTRGEAYNSKWFGLGDGAHPDNYLQLQTDERYAVPEVFVVENVQKTSFRIRWNNKAGSEYTGEIKEHFELDADGNYEIDEITVTPSSDNPEVAGQTFKFADYKDQGYIDVEGLEPNCVYLVNGRNTKVVRYWDSLYNTNTTRTKGDAIEPVLLKWEDWYDVNDPNTRAHQLQAARIDTMLLHYQTSRDYPEGTIFELEPKKVYYFHQGINISKGFTLRCSDPNVAPEDRPLVYMGIGWQKQVGTGIYDENGEEIMETLGVTKEEADMSAGYAVPNTPTTMLGRNPNLGEMGGINVQAITFENINFDVDGSFNFQNKPDEVGTGTGNYFLNQNSQTMPFTLAELNLLNCNFRGFIRGFVRFQGATRKQVDQFNVIGCMIYGCGQYDNNGRGYSMFVGDGTSPMHNVFKNFNFKNNTIVDCSWDLMLKEANNVAWASGWNVTFTNNTFVNWGSRTKDRIMFQMRYPSKEHLSKFVCKNNLFVLVRNGDTDTRKLFLSGMRVENNTEFKYCEFQDNYTTRCDVGGDPNAAKTDWGQALTNGFSSYQFSHTSRGAAAKVDGVCVNHPTNGGDPVKETHLKWFMKDDGTTCYEPNELFEDPSPKSSQGEPGMHLDYRRHNVSQSNEHISYYIPDGFYVKAEHKSKFMTASGEPIGDPRWLTK